jgi:Zn finger protein HypA/HybF involved in hydrogenase expression
MAGIMILVTSIIVSGASYLRGGNFEWAPGNTGFIYSAVLTLGFFVSIGAGVFGAIKEINEFLIGAGTSCIVLAIVNKLFANVLYSWSFLDTLWLLAGVLMIIDSVQVKRVKEARKLQELLKAEKAEPEHLLEKLDKLESENLKAQSDIMFIHERQIQEIKKQLWSDAKQKPELRKLLRMRLYNSPVVQEIIRRFIYQFVDVIEPKIESNETPTYSALSTLGDADPKKVQSALNDLVESGILQKDLYEKMIACPQCHRTSNIFARVKCPKCDSFKVNINRLMQHADCGAIYRNEEYYGPSGAICPKCGTKLSEESQLKNVGVVFECESCKSIFSDPNRAFYCRNCASEFQLKNSELTDIYSYRLSQDVKSEAKETLTVLEVADKIGKLGFTVSAPGTMTGRSGVNHEFTLTCSKKDKQMAIDFASAAEKVSTQTVLASYAKFMDVPSATKMIVAAPALEQQAKDLLKTNHIEYIETEDTDAIAEKIKGILG